MKVLTFDQSRPRSEMLRACPPNKTDDDASLPPTTPTPENGFAGLNDQLGYLVLNEPNAAAVIARLVARLHAIARRHAAQRALWG